jgi:hypothetical protein
MTTQTISRNYAAAREEDINNAAFMSWRHIYDRRYWTCMSTLALDKFMGAFQPLVTAVCDDHGDLVRVAA